MRRATHNVEWMTDNGTLVGLCLGFDFVSEHEWGIGRLKEMFGILSSSPVGMEDRKATRQPANVTFQRLKSKKGALAPAMLLVGVEPHDGLKPDAFELSIYGDKTLACSWDAKSFGVLAASAQDVANLETLRRAIAEHDVVLAPPSGASFLTRGGLTVSIYSRIPEEIRRAVREADLDQARLLAVAASTGIAERLKAAGKDYFALSPAWNADKSGVVFWLNPHDQQNNNYGWFTTDALDQWIANDGPIPKRAAVAARG